MYPIKFKPVYKEKVWGGESWEVACHREGNSFVCNGRLKNKAIRELVKDHAKEVFGQVHDVFRDRFPILMKTIEANDKLSVQVHPDDNYAKKYEADLGKNEMWYILDAKPGAKLIYGLKKGVTKEAFKKAIKNNDIGSTLREIEVEKGDMVYIPAGMIHAIGKGICIAEIQQSSDVTYRVYDWDRVGLDGKSRELHIKKALDVIDFDTYIEEPKIKNIELYEHGHKRGIGVSSKYFHVDVLDIDKYYSESLDGEKFEVFKCIDGKFNIEYKSDEVESFENGETVLMPANLGSFVLRGQGKVLRVRI